jgi:hypothetical protein
VEKLIEGTSFIFREWLSVTKAVATIQQEGGFGENE